MLNADGLRMHLASKRHKKQQGRLEYAGEDTIVYAEDLQEDSSGGQSYPSPKGHHLIPLGLRSVSYRTSSSAHDGLTG